MDGAYQLARRICHDKVRVMTTKKKPKAATAAKVTKPKRSRGRPRQVYLSEEEDKIAQRVLRRRPDVDTFSDLIRYWILRADQLHRNRKDRKRAAAIDSAPPVDPRQLPLPAA
jgi:hypothetical protein